MRLFSQTSITTPNLLNPWIKHTLHAFDAALQIHPRLKKCNYVFRKAPDSMSIDTICIKSSRFEFHHRWLDYDYVHKQRMTCPIFQNKNKRESQDESSICDCAVEELMDFILREIEDISPADKRQIERSYIDLLMTMPRDLSVTSAEDEEGIIRAVFNWKISATNYCGNFDVFIFPEDYGDTARKEHRFHCIPRAVPPLGISDPSTSTSVISSTELDSPTSSANQSPIDSQSIFGGSSSKLPLESATPVSALLWEEAEHSTSLVLDISNTYSIPLGSKFVAMIRPALDNRCFYSSPFPFTLPCPSPRKVDVQKIGCRITVSWEFLCPIVAKFQVTCESLYDITYKSDFISGRSHSFNIDDNLLTTELEVIVQAESDAGIKSMKVVVKVPAELMKSTSPNLESMFDNEDPASPVGMFPTYQLQSHHNPTDSRPKSSRTFQPPISQPPRRRLNSESLLSEVISVKEVSKKGLEGKGDQKVMEVDGLDSLTEVEYGFYDNMDVFSEDYPYAQPLSRPAPEQTSSDEEVSLCHALLIHS